MNENEAAAIHRAMMDNKLFICSWDEKRHMSFRYRWETWGAYRKYERWHLIVAGTFEQCLRALIGDDAK